MLCDSNTEPCSSVEPSPMSRCEPRVCRYDLCEYGQSEMASGGPCLTTAKPRNLQKSLCGPDRPYVATREGKDLSPAPKLPACPSGQFDFSFLIFSRPMYYCVRDWSRKGVGEAFVLFFSSYIILFQTFLFPPMPYVFKGHGFRILGNFEKTNLTYFLTPAIVELEMKYDLDSMPISFGIETIGMLGFMHAPPPNN